MIFWAFLAAQTLSEPDAQTAYGQADRVWATCMAEAAQGWASQNEPAETIADASVGRCGAEQQRARAAMIDWLAARKMAWMRADQVEALFREQTAAHRAALIGLILDMRSRK